MNKSVYLYELDSVRNSKEEIQYAQEQMFREIILNGNQVILTMNSIQSVTAADVENGESYLDIMTENLNVLKEALD